MVIQHGKSKLSIALLLSVPLMFTNSFAAKPIDLNQQKVNVLQSLMAKSTLTNNPIKIVETSRSTDFNKTLHLRFQETYQGHDVWGADGVAHLPKLDGTKQPFNSLMGQAGQIHSMDGTIYEDLAPDLKTTPATALTSAQADKALSTVITNYAHEVGSKINAQDQKAKLIVYVDDQHKAHWAFHVSFFVEPIKAGALPQKPNLIVDAITFKPYQRWDNIQTASHGIADGGGYGGNKKTGKLIYDGGAGHLDKLLVSRENTNCTLQNNDVTVKHYKDRQIVNYDCKATDPNFNNVYWDGELESTNGGYSPPNDALFGGDVIKAMYMQWYDVQVLTKNNKPMMLVMVVHDNIENAYWDGSKMTFGDGGSMFYPLTSLGVAAHEVSHGFTQQHSNLRYYGQSGGMNESFSDMAAMAAEQFAYNKVSWQIGGEIMKEDGVSLRYMDKPSKDCNGKRPGNWCSIDDASQYSMGLDVHYSSGVYNHFFYLLGSTSGWDAKKAFNVMLHANANYWTSSTTFATGACGVIKAATDLSYDVDAVKKAFDGVKISYANC